MHEDSAPTVASHWTTIRRIAVGAVLTVGPLVLLKGVIWPLVGLRRDVPPTEAIAATPLAFAFNVLSSVTVIVLGYRFYVRVVDGRPATELGWRTDAALVGAVSGAGLIGMPMLLLYLSGYYTVTGSNGLRLGALAIVFVVTTVVILEELVFRGLLFTGLERIWGSTGALLLQAAIFSAAHVFNDHWSGILPLLNGFVIGLVWGAIYMVSRNIWLIAMHHAAWNLTIFASGLPLTGIQQWRPLAPLESEMQGPVWLTGGVAGPEVSVLTSLVGAGAFWLVLRWHRHKASRAP